MNLERLLYKREVVFLLLWYLLDISKLNEGEYRKWYALMNQSKKERVDGFRFDEDKKRTVFSEMLARLALAQKAACPPESIVFSTHANGKPYALGLDLEFNVSHCSRWVACVVSDKPVGIDLEEISPIPTRLVRYVCTDQEYAFVLGGNEAQVVDTLTNRGAVERFFRVWTAKEAFVKYSGKGLAWNVKQIPWKASTTHCVILDECVLSICYDSEDTSTISQGNIAELLFNIDCDIVEA